MRLEKGITLISLGIYIVAVMIILGIIASITTTFNGTIVSINKEGKNNTELDKFNIYFLQEVKKQGNDIAFATNTEVVFATGNKYTFNAEKAIIYLNDNIVIANDIEKCTFVPDLVNGKKVITVSIKGKKTEERNINYVLSNKGLSSNYEDEDTYIIKNTI